MRTRLTPILAALAGWALLAGIAAAQGPVDTQLEVSLPPEPTVGQEMPVAVRLRDASGTPVAGVEVVLTRGVQFLSTEDVVEVGRAVTNKDGVATFTFIPRSEGAMTLTARFAAGEGYQRSATTVEAAVGPGPSLYEETVGIKVPGVGVWLLVGALTLVWGAYYRTMTLVRRISAQAPPPSQTEAIHRG